MSPETAHAIYTVLAFALGWTCHLGWRMLVDWHDSKKNHEIRRLQWENDRLKDQLKAQDAEAPLPMESEAVPPAPVPRKRRSPQTAKITPLRPLQTDTKKVPPRIPQADLGRMQAQLAAVGKCRAIYAGGNHP